MNRPFLQKHAPKLALLSVSFIWGITFPLGKYVITQMPVFAYLGLRFFMAWLLLGFLRHSHLKRAQRRDWVLSVWIGVALFGAFAFQTIGLVYTTAAKTSFATGLYVVFVPFLYFAFFRTPLTRPAIFAALLGGVGMALLGGDFSGLLDWDFGVTLVMISALFTALQIVGIGRYARQVDPSVLTFAQIGVVALLSLLAAFLFESWPSTLSWATWLSIVFLAVFATIIAYFIQCRVQQEISHTATAVILAMESVFGALLSWLFLGETLNRLMLSGGALLVTAMLIAQWEGSPAEENACAEPE